MNLYEINGQVLQLMELLDEGEIDEQTYRDTLDNLGGTIAVEEVIKGIRTKSAEAEAYKAEAERLTEKRQRAEKTVDSMKQLLLTYLTNTGQKKLKTGLFCVSKGTSKSANIIDEALIPAEYLIEQPAKVDKKAILAALKNGDSVQGAELKESEHIIIK
jgi:hypothetical protein